MFRDTEEIIITIPLDLAAILLIGIAMMAFHDVSANQAFLFAVSVVPLSRIWTAVYERRWGDDQPDQNAPDDGQTGLLQHMMTYVGFEIVLFIAFTLCSLWILSIDITHAILTGAILVAAHTTYWAMARVITEER